MKKFFGVALILVLLAAVAWFIWMNWGEQLSQLPGLASQAISRMLTELVGSLAGLGASVRDSFKMPGR